MNWLKTKVMGSGKLLNDSTIDGSMPGVCIKQVRGKWELEEKEVTEYMHHF